MPQWHKRCREYWMDVSLPLRRLHVPTQVLVQLSECLCGLSYSEFQTRWQKSINILFGEKSGAPCGPYMTAISQFWVKLGICA